MKIRTEENGAMVTTIAPRVKLHRYDALNIIAHAFYLNYDFKSRKGMMKFIRNAIAENGIAYAKAAAMAKNSNIEWAKAFKKSERLMSLHFPSWVSVEREQIDTYA